MTNKTKKLNEDATAGATSSGNIATVNMPLNNLLQRRLPTMSEMISNIYKKPKK